MATPAPELSTPVSRRQRERAYYIAAAIAFAAVTFAGFQHTWFLRFLNGMPPLPALIAFHGVLFTSWVVLFVVQIGLVAKKRTDIHRKLGVAGGVLAALMVIVGPLTAIAVTKPGYRPGPPTPLTFLTIPFFAIAVFGVLVFAALWYRRRPDIHKRLMLLATIAILPAAVARIPLTFVAKGGPPMFYGLTDLLLLACVAYDTIAHRKLHRAFLLGSLFLIASHPLSVMVSNTPAWLSFAQWIAR